MAFALLDVEIALDWELFFFFFHLLPFRMENVYNLNPMPVPRLSLGSRDLVSSFTGPQVERGSAC